MNWQKRNEPIQIGSRVYSGGLDNPNFGQQDTNGRVNLGFGHGDQNLNTGYERPAISGGSIENAVGWRAVTGAIGKSNINIGRNGK